MRKKKNNNNKTEIDSKDSKEPGDSTKFPKKSNKVYIFIFPRGYFFLMLRC